MRRLLTGLAALMLITSVAVAQGRPGEGPFRGGRLPPGVRVLEEGGGPGAGPQARPHAEAVGRAVRQLAQRLDRLEKAVREILANTRRTGPAARHRGPEARRGMPGRPGMAARHGPAMDRGERMRRLLRTRPELRQRLAQSPELRQRLAERFRQQGRMMQRGPMRGRGPGPDRAMRKRGGDHACPHCGKGGAERPKADLRDRARKARAMLKAGHRPDARGPAAARMARGGAMQGRGMAAENARLKAEIRKLHAQMARLAAEIKKLHAAR
jgi:hypothetical protein